MAIYLTEDGSHSIFSDRFGVSYHSKFGAIQESKHVFIEAALLHFQSNNSNDIELLEFGFGTGLNALLTLATSQNLDCKIHYTALEAFPLERDHYLELNYTNDQPLASFKKYFKLMHSLPFSERTSLTDKFTFEKIKMDFLDIDFENRFDVVYFDAFAPNAQPELWETNFFEKIYKAMKVGGVLTTYCAKGQVKRNFRSVGFNLESIPGPPGKREMIRVAKL